MAITNFTDFSNITYCGEEAQKIFAQDVYALDMRDYGITMMDGLKGKRKIYTGKIGDVWQKYSCPFTPQGEASLAEAFIEPVAVKANIEECYDAFWDTFLVEQTSISLQGGIPQTFSEWYFGKLREKMSREYQEMFWQGDTAYTGTVKEYLKVVDGVEKQLANATGATHITGAAITVDNVIAQVEAAIMAAVNKANAQELDTDAYKVFMNYADIKVLEVALGKLIDLNLTNRVFDNYSRQNGHIYVMGYEIVPTMQSKNSIIVGDPRNLVLGFDSYDSHLEYKLINLRDTTGDNAFRVIAISNIGVGIVFPESFVISKP